MSRYKRGSVGSATSMMSLQKLARKLRSSYPPRRYLPAGPIFALTAIWLSLASILLPSPLLAQDYTYGECSAVEPEALEAEIEGLARTILVDGQGLLNIDVIVDRQWIAVGMDATLDQAVETAVAALMAEELYWERFLSGWSGAKAEEFAMAITQRVFSSPQFVAKLDELAAAIADDVTVELESMAARSASTSLLCLQQYVGERYSESLLTLFETEIRTDIEVADLDASPDDLDVSQLTTHSKAATGAGIIIATQVVRRLSVQLGKKVAGRVAGRIVGRVLGKLGSSLIPLAGWVVGGGLIVWDLVEGGQGSLPQIEDSLKGEEVKVALRAEIAAAVESGLDDEVDLMAAQIADELMGEWDQFCQRHPYLCSLPEESAQFQAILDATSVEELDKLAGLVDIFVTDLGRPRLDASLDNGAFEALLQLSEQVHAILSETASAETTLAWADLAGDNVDEVVRLGLYQLVDPSMTDEAEVGALIGLADAETISHYFATTPETRVALLAYSPATRKGLLERLDPADVDWLITYMAAEQIADAESMAYRIANGIETLAMLQSPPAAAKQGPSKIAPAGLSLPEAALVLEPDSKPDASPRQNSVLVAALLLSVVLAISAFALVGWNVVKRSQH